MCVFRAECFDGARGVHGSHVAPHPPTHFGLSGGAAGWRVAVGAAGRLPARPELRWPPRGAERCPAGRPRGARPAPARALPAAELRWTAPILLLLAC